MSQDILDISDARSSCFIAVVIRAVVGGYP